MSGEEAASERKSESLPDSASRATLWAESWWGSLLLSLVFSLAMIYNCVFPLNAVWATDGIIEPDCGQMIWNLWHVNERVTGGHNPYAAKEVWYPIGAPNLSHHTLAAGYLPVSFLVKSVSRADALYPLYAYRLLIWLCFTLLLYGSYRLLRELNCSRRAAAVAAIAFSFADFYMEHIAHLNMLAGFFIPLAALCVVRLYRRPDSLAKVFTAALLLSGAIYFTELTLYIYLGLFFILLLMLARPAERRTLAAKFRLAGRRRILVGLAVYTLVAAPFLWLLLTDDFIKPPASDISLYSANLAGFFAPNPVRTPLYGHLFDGLAARTTIGIGGYEVFISFVLLSCAVIALWKSKQKRIAGVAVIAIIFYALSLGPTLKVLSVDTGFPMPYRLLMSWPPFDASRTPSRFVVMGLFFLMIAAAHGLTWINATTTARWGKNLSCGVMALFFVWATAEAYSPTPRQQAIAAPSGLDKIVAGPVLNLPLLERDGYSAFLQTFHQQPIATAYLARSNEARLAQLERLRLLLERGGAELCGALEQMGFRNIVIAPRAYLLRHASHSPPLNLSQCGINVVDLRQPDGVTAEDDKSAEGILLGQPPAFPMLAAGTRVSMASAESEPFLWYGWSGREPFSRWTEQGSAAITFSLAESEPRVMRLKLIPFLAPGRLDAQRVSVRLNGELLTTLKLTEAVSKVYSITLPRQVLRERNVVSFELPDADAPRRLGVGADARLLGINVEWLELADARADQ